MRILAANSQPCHLVPKGLAMPRNNRRITLCHVFCPPRALTMKTPETSTKCARKSPLLLHAAGRASSCLRRCDREIHDLANLPPRGVVAGPELQAARPTAVPGDDALAVSGLYE